jgi:hypothetical protein
VRPGDPNAAVIESFFGGSFDLTPLDLAALNQMLANLAALRVGNDGKLKN